MSHRRHTHTVTDGFEALQLCPPFYFFLAAPPTRSPTLGGPGTTPRQPGCAHPLHAPRVPRKYPLLAWPQSSPMLSPAHVPPDCARAFLPDVEPAGFLQTPCKRVTRTLINATLYMAIIFFLLASAVGHMAILHR